MSDALRALLKAKLGVGGRNLPDALARAGRRLPRAVRTQAQMLVEAERQAVHPKFARQVDAHAVRRGYRAVVAHLEAIDLADRRRGWLLGVAGALAFNVLLAFALFVTWLWWQGYV